MDSRDNLLFDRAVQDLRARLPMGWKAIPSRGDRQVDGYVRLSAPDKRSTRVAIEVKRRLEPRDIVTLRNQFGHHAADEPWLVVAPFLSPAVRDRLRESNLAFMDLTGNVRLELSEPGLYIQTTGADVDPDPKSRPSRSLRGDKAGRVVRALVDSKTPPGVRAIAERADVDPGYVSRVLSLLDREALIERHRRRVVKVDWVRLLRRWAEDAPLSSRGAQAMFIEPRGLAALERKLARLGRSYALTGSLAAARLAPVAPPRLATIYVEDGTKAAKELELRPAETGGNVLIIEPNDSGVFTGSLEERGLRYAAPSQVAADLLTSPGRGPNEADELIAWMVNNEDVWRG